MVPLMGTTLKERMLEVTAMLVRVRTRFRVEITSDDQAIYACGMVFAPPTAKACEEVWRLHHGSDAMWDWTNSIQRAVEQIATGGIDE